jgi:hypothetical protein
MIRCFAVLCGVMAFAFAPAVRAADQPPNQPAPAAQQPPVIINYPSGAQQPPAGGEKNLPTIVSLQSMAGIKVAAAPAAPAGQRAANMAIAELGDIVSLPYLAAYTNSPAFDYAPAYGSMYSGYGAPGFGYGYGYGYASPAYSAAYTLAYDAWAQPRPLPTAVYLPVGTISTGPSNMMWYDQRYTRNR